jgi:hypothetical protein
MWEMRLAVAAALSLAGALTARAALAAIAGNAMTVFWHLQTLLVAVLSIAGSNQMGGTVQQLEAILIGWMHVLWISVHGFAACLCINFRQKVCPAVPPGPDAIIAGNVHTSRRRIRQK